MTTQPTSDHLDAAADRQDRRTILGVLLGRMQRGALLDSERALLADLVTREIADADDSAADARDAATLRDHHQRMAKSADNVNAHLKQVLARRTETLRTRAEQAEAERDRYRTAWRNARRRSAGQVEQPPAPPVPFAYRAPAGDAHATLDRIRDAHQWADVQAHLGMYYGWTAEQSGQRARAYRTAEQRAADGDAIRAAARVAAVRARMLAAEGAITRITTVCHDLPHETRARILAALDAPGTPR